jgi:hypothetical protein
MLVYNYSKCPIKYHCSDDLSKKSLHLKSEFNLKFLLDFKCSSPDFNGITYSIHDLDSDILYMHYDVTKFNKIINNKVFLTKIIVTNCIYECLYSTSKIDGINRTHY